MNIGDLVKRKPEWGPWVNKNPWMHTDKDLEFGIVTDLLQKKVWRTEPYGKNIDWEKIKPEPHAIVLWSTKGTTTTVPVADLKVVNDGSG